MEYTQIDFIYDGVKIDVRFSIDENTIWLSKEQISILFDRNRSVVSRHIKKILDEDTSLEKSNVHFLHIAISDKPVKFYSLDIVLMVGRRIKSPIVPIFCTWCKQTLEKIRQEKTNESNYIRFNEENLSLDVKIVPEEDTVYLTQNQIALLFETTQQNISFHINNIINEEELEYVSVHKDYLYTASDGKQYYVAFYNLDMILAIGYRVKSKRAIAFRKWASKVLKEYLYKGYVIDEERTLVTNENYINLINKVDKLENRISKIEEKEKYHLIQDKFVYEDSVFDAKALLISIIEVATTSLVLIDPYIDIRTLSIFKEKKKGVVLNIITSSKNNKISQIELNDFNNTYGDLYIYIDDRYHDKYIIIDDKLFYHIGSSINYLGRRFSQVTLIKEDYFIETLRNRVNAVT